MMFSALLGLAQKTRPGFRPAYLFPLLLLAVGCSDSVGPEEPVSFFPLEVGNQWTYAPEDAQFGDPFQWEVTGRTGDTVMLSRPSGGSHPGPVTVLDRTEGVDLSLGENQFGPSLRFSPGASWTRRDPWECDDGSEWVAETETEPITTPAGTFNNVLRLERRTSANCTDAGTTFEWWAPGVGLLRWEELNFYAGGPLTFNLTSYSAALATSEGR
jgi:hypothetical protein